MFIGDLERERIKEQILKTLSIPSGVSISGGTATIKLPNGRALKVPYTNGGAITTFFIDGKTYFTVGDRILELP
jgi:hypothetical protein